MRVQPALLSLVGFGLVLISAEPSRGLEQRGTLEVGQDLSHWSRNRWVAKVPGTDCELQLISERTDQRTPIAADKRIIAATVAAWDAMEKNEKGFGKSVVLYRKDGPKIEFERFKGGVEIPEDSRSAIVDAMLEMCWQVFSTDMRGALLSKDKPWGEVWVLWSVSLR